MSVGNVPQIVKFTNSDISLVLGENLDLGGNDNRNGTGKSTIINALSYVIYGSALTNIKKDNLVNKTNAKNMLVTLSFSVNGVDFIIERGRKANVFSFYEVGKKDPNLKSDLDDDAQGEGRHTQEMITKLFGMTHDMFKHILALNTSIEPFLSTKASDQRAVIEQLLGITVLSEKAESLKADLKDVKDSIKEEEFKIKAASDANARIENNIRSLQNTSKKWEQEKEHDIDGLQDSIISMMTLDIDAEIEAHKNNTLRKELQGELRVYQGEINNHTNNIKAYERLLNAAKSNLECTNDNKCPTCNHELGAEKHESLVAEANEAVKTNTDKIKSETILLENAIESVNLIKSSMPEYIDTFYKSIDEAYNHKSSLDALTNELSSELDKVNPYTDQIESLRKNALIEISYDNLNQMNSLKEHQEFLLRLLTNKESFIRKKIIDQNINFLNSRLSYYLGEIGLPHFVEFRSDLEVEISLYGKEYDFDNLSRGEKTRLTVSLSFAFRDVFESMFNKVNLVFVDELIDNGLDGSGVESALQLLKTMWRDNGKNVFLISHRDELIGRVSNVLKVVKEAGFTTYVSSDEDDSALID